MTLVEEPKMGGSYLRDPDTGKLTLVEKPTSRSEPLPEPSVAVAAQADADTTEAPESASVSSTRKGK